MSGYEIGRVVGVHGFRVKVELHSESKSPSRAGLEGVRLAIAINAYLAFDIGAGEFVIGNITDLDSRESFDPKSSGEMTLELVKARRIASVQLLGTLRPGQSSAPQLDFEFTPSVTVLPTLDTPAHAATRNELAAIFSDAPSRNKPDNIDRDEAFDWNLDIGVPTGSPENMLFGSFNDLFSRPLAIVGNTGSGKSYTVASVLQRALSVTQSEPEKSNPRFFVLDINGEYGRAFEVEPEDRQPDTIYLNGEEFWLPVWLMNARESCEWLSATEQTQEPVLKACWAALKSGSPIEVAATAGAANFVRTIEEQATSGGGAYTGTNIRMAFDSAISLLSAVQRRTLDVPMGALMAQVQGLDDHAIGDAAGPLRDAAAAFNEAIAGLPLTHVITESADKPIAFEVEKLRSAPLASFAETEGTAQLSNWLVGLQLRLDNRLADRRWRAFTQFEALDFETWLRRLGIGAPGGKLVQVLDLSMLAHEVLPYACGIIGRVLLELRERIPAAERFKEPWVIVLEEAHNYVRPRRQEEDRGVAVSRDAFERVAKEGRKFGLSLVVASQRPSEVSPTILSQCANFFLHRLQNPQDIEHFKSIIPEQARRLLEQVMVLAQGEAITFGSAFHIPTRAQIHRPWIPPHSQTAAPYWEWQKSRSKGIELGAALRNWGLGEMADDAEGAIEAAVEDGD